MSTEDAENLPLPDPKLLEMQSKLANVYRSFYVEDIIKSEGVLPSTFKSSGISLVSRLPVIF